MAMQIGGWYPNPGAGGKVQRYWGSAGWTDGADPTQTNKTSPSQLADQYYNQAADQENSYIDSLIKEAGGQRDLIVKKLDAEHKLALGNDDTARAQFLESVADKLEEKIGRIPYDYQRYNARELDRYAMETGHIKQNQDLALRKLDADEKALKGEQVQTNQNTAEDLNSRGLIEGQTPTFNKDPNATSGPNFLNGLSGLAGNQASIVNNDYGYKFNSLGLDREGINLGANQQLEEQGFQNKNTLQDLTVGARRDAQDQENATTFGKQGAENDYNEKVAALERKRKELLQQDRQNSYTKAGVKSGVLGY